MSSQSLQTYLLPGGNYGYTGASPDALKSSDNTIVTALLDESGSTRSYARQMELAIKEIIRSLQHCTAKDKLVYRHCHFDTDFREVHGFKPLLECHESDYDGVFAGGGQTALYQSCGKVLDATVDYAEQLAKKRYMANGIIYIITDGLNYVLNSDGCSEDTVKSSLEKALGSEVLESLNTILIGVNDNPTVQQKLENFATNVGFTQYIPLKDASEKSLAKMANFISQSVMLQSQALRSGGPSQSLTF